MAFVSKIKNSFLKFYGKTAIFVYMQFFMFTKITFDSYPVWHFFSFLFFEKKYNLAITNYHIFFEWLPKLQDLYFDPKLPKPFKNAHFGKISS